MPDDMITKTADLVLDAQANAGWEEAQKMKMPKKQTGFALMDKELAKTISAKGGKAAHMRGTAHHFTHDEAVAAALKGVAKRRAAKMNNEG